MLKCARQIIYLFIWDDQRGIIWKMIVLPKTDGGLGLRDSRLLYTASTIKRCIRILGGENLFLGWMDVSSVCERESTFRDSKEVE